MSRFMQRLLIGSMLCFALPSAGFPAETHDALVGDWQLNAGKSRFVPGPPPKGQLRSYRIDGDEEKLTARGIDADGKPTHVHYTARYDGKDYPIAGSLGGTLISLKRVDALTTESTQKRDGKPAITATRIVSPDGKTLTVISKGTTREGATIDTVAVFDKR